MKDAVMTEVEEKMTEDSKEYPTDFFDVFISYRHRDADRIKELEEKIRSLGFTYFSDLNFPEFKDTSNVTRKKIEDLRFILSRATCLIFAYSRRTAEQQAASGTTAEQVAAPDTSVGAWMPWELGFFDGSISARIGVYLLDGEPVDFEPKVYFKGSEYLQLYRPLTDANLKAFLDDNAVPERRVDNVNSAFVWFEHLYRECLANPTNVSLGVVEWYADHAARFCKESGIKPMGDIFASFKEWLDYSRVTWVRQLRSPVIEPMLGNAHAQRQSASRAVASIAKAAATFAGGAAQAPAKGPAAEGALGMPLDFSSTLLGLMNPWRPFNPMVPAATGDRMATRAAPAIADMATHAAPRRGHGWW